MKRIKKIVRALSRSESYSLCKDPNVKKKTRMSSGDIETTLVQETQYGYQRTFNQESYETDTGRVASEVHSDVEKKAVPLKSKQNHIQASREDVDLQAASSKTDMDDVYGNNGQIEQSIPKKQAISKGHASGVPRSLTHICAAQLNPENISYFLNYYGARSKQGSGLLSWLCSELKGLSSDIIQVWVGYEAVCAGIPVFVAVMKQKDGSLDDKFRSICPFKVVQRLSHEVSEEAKHCLKYENDHRNFSLEEFNELHDSVAEHTADLLKSHSNLQIVSSSAIKSRQSGNFTEVKTCIVLYVHVKGIIPFLETPFPTTVGKFPTDVREGLFNRYAGSKLTLGCDIYSRYGYKGRLGGFVRLSNGKLGCLTCWHTFDTPESREDYTHGKFDKNVYHLPPVPGQRPFGSIWDTVYTTGNSTEVGVDAALIEITDRLRAPEDGRFHVFYGAESDQLAEFYSGEILTSKEEIAELQISERAKCKIIRHNESNQRYIRTGFMNVSNACLSWSPANPGEKCQLFSQIEIDPDIDDRTDDQRFAVVGDSGSLVFLATEDNQNVWAIGMVVGGISPKGSAIVTPIWTILDSFGLPRSLLSFESQRLRRIELSMKDTKDAFEMTNQKLAHIELQTHLTNQRLNGIEQTASQYFTEILQRLPPP